MLTPIKSRAVFIVQRLVSCSKASIIVFVHGKQERKCPAIGEIQILLVRLGDTYPMLGSTAPAAWWMMYHIFSNNMLRNAVREELESLARRERTESNKDTDDEEI